MTELFTGPMFFVNLTINYKKQDYALTPNDVQTILNYAQQVMHPITRYLNQYGPSGAMVDPIAMGYTFPLRDDQTIDLGTFDSVADSIFTTLPTNSCLVILVPPLSPTLFGDFGFSYGPTALGNHSSRGLPNDPKVLAHPYAIIGMNGQFSSPNYSGDLIGENGGAVTVRDEDRIFAPQLSAQMAQMIADPYLMNKEVCTSCGPVKVVESTATENYQDIYQFFSYFDTNGQYLGSNRTHTNKFVLDPLADQFRSNIYEKYAFYISAISSAAYALEWGADPNVINGNGNAAPEFACVYAPSGPEGISRPTTNRGFSSAQIVIPQPSDAGLVLQPMGNGTEGGPTGGDPVTTVAQGI